MYTGMSSQYGRNEISADTYRGKYYPFYREWLLQAIILELVRVR